MKILLTGVSGLIGKNLALHLMRQGHEVAALARRPESVGFLPEQNVSTWNSLEPPPLESLRGFDAIVHLAGEGVADQRWTESRKKLIRDSRVLGTAHLVSALGRLQPEERPKTLINASAIGYYGDGADRELAENTPPGQDFLAHVCAAWEKEANQASELGIRVTTLRLGIVFSEYGGALSKMAPVRLGDGRQWMSWIHLDDVVGFISYALHTPSISGPFNLSSPQPIRQEDFVKALKKIRTFPLPLYVPKTVLSLALGEMAEMITGSQRVLPKRTLEAGYRFQYDRLEAALEKIYSDLDPKDLMLNEAQFVSRPRHEVFSFFSRAENLEILTPPWLNFKITNQSTATITQNTLIDYKLRIHKIPVRWRTLISHWNPPNSFTDDQLKGPYRKWHHVHRFEEVSGGTLLTDRVTFRVPFGWVGKLLLSRWIMSDVRTIFNFRKATLRSLEKTGRLS